MKIPSSRIKIQAWRWSPRAGGIRPTKSFPGFYVHTVVRRPPQACPHKMHTISTETPINTIFKCLDLVVLFYVDEYACMQVCTPHACLVPAEVIRQHWNWSYRWLWVKSRSSAKQGVLTCTREAFLGAVRVGRRNSLQITAVHEVQPEHSHVLCCTYTPL